MIGLDIGGTKMEVALFDDNVQLLCSWRRATPKEDYSAFIDSVVELIHEADQRFGSKSSIGIGIPGFINLDGESFSANVPCLNGQNIRNDLKTRFARSVAIDNDTKNFVYSEANGGAGDGFANMLGLVLGTGVAGNQSIDGSLVRGANGLAGEYGHLPMPVSLIDRYNFPILECGCGAVGCVEPYLAGPGLQWMSGFFGGSYQTVQALFEGLSKNESAAEKTFSAYMDCLGQYLSYLNLAFDPDLVVVGGGLSKVDKIFEYLPAAIRRHTIDGFSVPGIARPKYGDSSGVRGAALIGAAEVSL